MGHEHVSLKNNKAKPILLALILTSIFLVVEAIGGFIFGSLALIADAAHMLTDVTALTIALVAIKIGQKAADSVRTFGYYRLYDNNDFNKLWGSFHDEIYNIIADCTIKKVPTPAGTPEKISFDLYNAWRKNDPSFYQGLPSTFGVPDNVVLIKQ